MIQHAEVRRGMYHDSVTLMVAGRAVSLLDGVGRVLVGMGTDLNLEMLGEMGFPPVAGCGASDLLVAFEGASAGVVTEALGVLAAALAPSAGSGSASASSGGATSVSGGGETVPPRTVGSALRRSGGKLALISTPGPHAFVEAVDALEAGASVVVFSDNVPVSQEVALKELAASRGLLVMGPDCGTVVVGGVGLGFANVVRPGPVSLVAASGTGSQQVMTLLDAAGVGVRHCLGVGGRDLSLDVAGRSTIAALSGLDADVGTEMIVIVSKEPHPDVAEFVAEHARGLTTPVVYALLGDGRPDLTAAVETLLGRMGYPVPTAWPAWRTASRGADVRSSGLALRGLFSGGTLCQEAASIVGEVLGDAGTGAHAEVHADTKADAERYRFTDFGDDRYTRGRPHPMIDNSLRLAALAECAADGEVGVVLLDVVLGRGAHPDPGGVLAPAVASAVEHGKSVVVSLCGTAGDPQGLEQQAAVLVKAGADVFASNAEAARHAAGLLT